MVFGFILNFQKKFSTNIPKSDTAAKNTKTLILENLFKFEKVFLDPIEIMVQSLGWKVRQTASLEDFF